MYKIDARMVTDIDILGIPDGKGNMYRPEWWNEPEIHIYWYANASYGVKTAIAHLIDIFDVNWHIHKEEI